MFLKIGELAKQTGVSIRTLHYYDEIGLLKPSHHTEAAHRLYTDVDIIRLQQIMSLRQLSFSLETIRECLESSKFSLHKVINLHISQTKEQIELQQRLYNRLQLIAANLQLRTQISIEEFIQIIKDITMLEKYYTQEQLEYLHEKRHSFGENRISQIETDWIELISQVSGEMEKGTDPTSKTVLSLARRWMNLMNEFTGGNPEIQKSLNTIYKQEQPELVSRGIINSEILDYISQAIAVLQK